MAENNTVILEELKKATEQVQKVVEMEAKEQAAYKEAVAKQFFELQKAVHSIISEEGIILKNFEWVWVRRELTDQKIGPLIKKQANLLACEYGFSNECVERILKIKNEGEYVEGQTSNFYPCISYYKLVPKKN